ncbi:cytochrome P450 [Gamsiella multidivaricata]|uniref:cytochrome P450 n=1 Tax=Gamsiella multidivaricata TaxID=101098 RepID=UPI0022207FD7|nr:cytochrome P450 [Gamsiella multidivaricata]KAI7823344.1 cytochrome P450 [Gamsiella multidivaricata]
MNEDFSAGDAIDEFTGMRTFFDSVRKSNMDLDNRTIHEVVRDNISPNLQLFTPRIVEQLVKNLEKELGTCPAEEGGKYVEKPMKVLQEMVASAMANVFVGPEIAKSRKVIDTFITATVDFGKMLGNGQRRASFWRTFIKRANYRVLNPLQVHVRTLVDAASPVILERRRQETEANEKGLQYERPDDVLQRLLDNFDKYGFIDLEDVCGHLLILVLASVHTTTDTSTNLLYYMAAFPEYLDKLYEEQQQVLDTIQKEREEQRQALRAKNEEIGEELDPTHDRDLSAAAIKKMVHMDSFVREVFRFRTERLTLVHRARKTVTLSSGIVIQKGGNVIINMRSAHQSPEQGEDVTAFRPWRFVGKPKAATKAGADFLPFGMGRHACPGRFLAIQELKTIGVLMVSRYSKIEMKDPSKTSKALRTRIGEPTPTGLTFISRS